MQHVSETLDRRSETVTAQQRATKSARLLQGTDSLEVKFISTETNPYDEDGNRKMRVYRDRDGFEYWLDEESGKLLQAGLSEDRDKAAQPARPRASRPVIELRELAVDIAARMNPGFKERLSHYHPLEANDRRAVYFFRWEDLSEPLSESELPPFVQVALRPDGSMAGYTDTMSLRLPVVPEGDAEHCSYPPASWSKAETGAA
jgi:hypothetical protein